MLLLFHIRNRCIYVCPRPLLASPLWRLIIASGFKIEIPETFLTEAWTRSGVILHPASVLQHDECHELPPRNGTRTSRCFTMGDKKRESSVLKQPTTFMHRLMSLWFFTRTCTESSGPNGLASFCSVVGERAARWNPAAHRERCSGVRTERGLEGSSYRGPAEELSRLRLYTPTLYSVSARLGPAHILKGQLEKRSYYNPKSWSRWLCMWHGSCLFQYANRGPNFHS